MRYARYEKKIGMGTVGEYGCIIRVGLGDIHRIWLFLEFFVNKLFVL